MIFSGWFIESWRAAWLHWWPSMDQPSRIVRTMDGRKIMLETMCTKQGCQLPLFINLDLHSSRSAWSACIRMRPRIRNTSLCTLALSNTDWPGRSLYMHHLLTQSYAYTWPLSMGITHSPVIYIAKDVASLKLKMFLHLWFPWEQLLFTCY